MLPSRNRDIVLITAMVLLVFALIAWFSAPAQAQFASGCADVKAGSAKLKQSYGETPVFRGVSKSGYMVIIFLNADTGTWTAGRITPQNRKIMCPIDAGEGGSVRIGPSIQKDKKRVEQKW